MKEEEKKINNDAILQDHFENKILKSARYTTKYQNKTGKCDEKEQKYFIASFYRDANITEDDDFKNNNNKKPKSEEEDKIPLTFATCFSKNNNGNFIEQPFDKMYTYSNEDDTYPAYGIIYEDFHTAVWSKRDNRGEDIINFFHNLENHEHSKEIIDFLKGNNMPMNISELRENGIKRIQIKELIKFLKDNHYGSKINDCYGESIYPGENAIQQYLSKLDDLRYRIGTDLEHDDKELKEANKRAKTPFQRALDEPRYEFLMYDKENKNIAYIGYTDNKVYSGGKVENNTIDYDDDRPYRSTITYDKKQKEMIYNLACNEFISQQNEKVASFVVWMKNFTDNNFTENTLHIFFQQCNNYGIGEANIPKLYKMIFAQKDLGIPYMPILGGDGRVLCVKLSKLLSMMKDDSYYKTYINDNPPEKIKNEIKTKQTELNKIKAGPPLKDDDEDIKKINKKLKELQLTLIEEITDDTIKEMEEFEKEKISELQQQANKPDDTEIKKSEEKNTSENKNIKLPTNKKESNKVDNGTTRQIEHEKQSDKEKDNTSSWNCDDMFNNCTNNLRNTWPCSICFGNNN